MPGELARDAGLTAEQEVTRVLKSILDRLVSEMTDQFFSWLRDLNTQFGFLLDTKSPLLHKFLMVQMILIPSCVHIVCTLARLIVMTSTARS